MRSDWSHRFRCCELLAASVADRGSRIGDRGSGIGDRGSGIRDEGSGDADAGVGGEASHIEEVVGVRRKRDSRTRGGHTIQICLTWRDNSSNYRRAVVHSAGFSARRKENLTLALRTIANVSIADRGSRIADRESRIGDQDQGSGIRDWRGTASQPRARRSVNMLKS